MECNFKRTLNLIGGSSYKTCKADIVEETMREFKKEKLKTKSKRLITDRNQAIAVALSMAGSQCHYTKADANKLIEKVDRNLNNKKKELILSNIIETKDALVYLLKHNRHKKANEYKQLLWDKIIRNESNDKKLSKHMWDEIRKINHII
jgi:hypothetical protein